MTDQPMTFAWCFSHGTMHRFKTGTEPWCTASWVGFTAPTEEVAQEAKRYAYGDARFLHDLPVERQMEVIQIGAARA